MADDKKNIPDVASPTEAPAPRQGDHQQCGTGKVFWQGQVPKGNERQDHFSAG